MNKDKLKIVNLKTCEIAIICLYLHLQALVLLLQQLVDVVLGEVVHRCCESIDKLICEENLCTVVDQLLLPFAYF